MSESSLWQQSLVLARRQQRDQGGTVWDALQVQQEGGGGTEAWRERLLGMGVRVLSYAPEVRAQAAALAPEEGFWLHFGPNASDTVLLLADPWNDELVRRAAERQQQALPALATCSAEDFLRWRQQLRAGDKPVGASATAEAKSSAPGLESAAPQLEAGDAGEVVRFVNQALIEAVTHGASDIHFECNRLGLEVKLRVDGVLRVALRLANPQRALEVISRIKVLAQLDITEQRVPQDGRFRHVFADRGAMDLRVSIMPSVHGEDAVLRLLDRAQLRQREASSSLDALGFDEQSVQRIRELGRLPHGMLLVTGPTGSGKTTTVYGMLSELNSGAEKIITIEDPVEYELPGVLQIPVNERKGLTFAKGLRSILRHDPDRILVGEIRDADTAEIAVQSALTGHQVFTTVHANSLFDVTGRFRHFGLDMFGFMAALNGVVVQRLVRALCPACTSQRASTPRERLWLTNQGQPALETVPVAVGCAGCASTGYRRRFVIAEVHEVDDQLRDLVTAQQSIAALREHVRRSGVRSLGQVAAEAVTAQRTSLEEVQRVLGLV